MAAHFILKVSLSNKERGRLSIDRCSTDLNSALQCFMPLRGTPNNEKSFLGRVSILDIRSSGLESRPASSEPKNFSEQLFHHISLNKGGETIHTIQARGIRDSD
jgi:hypothetical protein